MKPAARILQKAVRKLQRCGVSPEALMNKDGAYCAAGVIYSVAGVSDEVLRRASVVTLNGDVVETQEFEVDGTPQMHAAMKAQRIFAKVIRRAEFGGKYDAYRSIYGINGIAAFNADHPDLVIPAMKQALKEAQR